MRRSVHGCAVRGYAVQEGALGRALAPVAARVREGEHGLSPLADGVQDVGSCLMAYMQADPDLSAVLLGSTVVRMRNGRA